MTQRHSFTTKDGSKTIYWPQFDEHYHSVHGAITESKHIFIHAGLEYVINQQKQPVAVLELGFGTGLNALLTYKYSENHQVSVNYTTIEAFPLRREEVSLLEYSQLLNLSNTTIQEFHNWEKTSYQVSGFFNLKKIKAKLENLTFNDRFHLIYFDAFAPSAQPELWETEIFQQLYDVLKVGGILVTYCAKGVVKRRLKKVGFTVEALPGPPGKREMTRAIKNR